MDQERLGQTNDILRRVALALEKLAPNQQTTQQAIDALLRIGITDSGKKADDPSKGSGDSRGGGRSRDRGDSGGDEDSGGGKGPPKVPDQSSTGMLRGLGPSASRLFGAGESLLPGFGLGEIGGTISKMVNLLSAFDGAKEALGRMGFLGDASQKLGPPGLPPPLPPDVRTLPLSPDGPEKDKPELLPAGSPLGKLPEAVPAWKDNPLSVEEFPELKPADHTTPPTPELPKATSFGDGEKGELRGPFPKIQPTDWHGFGERGLFPPQPIPDPHADGEHLPRLLPLTPTQKNPKTQLGGDRSPELPGPQAPQTRLFPDEQLDADSLRETKPPAESMNSPGLLGPLLPVKPAGADLTGASRGGDDLPPITLGDAASEGGDDIPMLNPQSPESGVEPPSTQIGAVGGDGEELPPADDGQADGPAVSELKNIGSTMKKIEEKTKPQADPQAKSRTHLGKSQSGEASGATTAHKDRGDVYGATIGQIEDRLAKVAEVALKVI